MICRACGTVAEAEAAMTSGPLSRSAEAAGFVIEQTVIEAEDFRDQTLITYPVDRARLDVFSQLLIPAKVEPAAVRQVELTAVILLLVASNRGVAVLPDWVVNQIKYNADYVTRPLTKGGLTRRLFAATRTEDTQRPFVAHLIRLARQEAVRMQRA